MTIDQQTQRDPLSKEEIYRRLPALNRIEDGLVRHWTAQASANVPDYFWEVPASRSNYHHPVCRKKRGLWIHTLMVFTAVERLVDSYEARFGVNPDYARAAALLHDQRKNGPPESPSTSSTSDHDLQMAEYIRSYDGPELVARAVECHMGAWYDGPEPDSPLCELVHNADMLASTANATLALPGPIPEELQQYDLKEANL